MSGLAVNGKFLSASPTGVHRVAAELISAVDARLTLGSSQAWKLLKPRDAHRNLGLAAIPERVVGVATWQPWEQFELPWHARHERLLNLCNLGPVAHNASIVMMHDAQVFSTPESYGARFRAWYQIVQPLLGRRALRILTVSEFSAAQLVEYSVAPPSKISVVPNGCDHFASVEVDTEVVGRLELEPGGYVVALANAQAHKNIARLLEAFADPRLKRLRLVLVGRADAREFTKVGTNVPSGVLFAGVVSDGEFKALIASSLCLAFPSLTEGFGLPPMEAMAIGCAVVAAPCGSLPEVCGDAALYAPALDTGAWVDAFLHLEADDNARRRAVELGLQRAALFTWDRSAQRLLEIVDQV